MIIGTTLLAAAPASLTAGLASGLLFLVFGLVRYSQSDWTPEATTRPGDPEKTVRWFSWPFSWSFGRVSPDHDVGAWVDNEALKFYRRFGPLHNGEPDLRASVDCDGSWRAFGRNSCSRVEGKARDVEEAKAVCDAVLKVMR